MTGALERALARSPFSIETIFEKVIRGQLFILSASEVGLDRCLPGKPKCCELGCKKFCNAATRISSVSRDKPV